MKLKQYLKSISRSKYVAVLYSKESFIPSKVKDFFNKHAMRHYHIKLGGNCKITYIIPKKTLTAFIKTRKEIDNNTAVFPNNFDATLVTIFDTPEFQLCNVAVLEDLINKELEKIFDYIKEIKDLINISNDFMYLMKKNDK